MINRPQKAQTTSTADASWPQEIYILGANDVFSEGIRDLLPKQHRSSIHHIQSGDCAGLQNLARTARKSHLVLAELSHLEADCLRHVLALRATFEHSNLIILHNYREQRLIEMIMACEVEGYIPLLQISEEIEAAIDAIRKGNKYISTASNTFFKSMT